MADLLDGSRRILETSQSIENAVKRCSRKVAWEPKVAVREDDSSQGCNGLSSWLFTPLIPCQGVTSPPAWLFTPLVPNVPRLVQLDSDFQSTIIGKDDLL